MRARCPLEMRAKHGEDIRWGWMVTALEFGSDMFSLHCKVLVSKFVVSPTVLPRETVYARPHLTSKVRKRASRRLLAN